MRSILQNTKGSILITTLLVIFLLSAMALNLGHYCQRDISRTKVRLQQLKTFHLAQGSLELVIDDMFKDKEANEYDAINEEWIKKYQDAKGSKILSFNDPQGNVIGSYEVFIRDEGAKLNINRIDAATLENLLSQLQVPGAKNKANDIIAMRNNKKPLNKIITYNELLNFKGITPEYLYGEDLNSNHFLDPEENDGKSNLPDDDQDNILDLGLKGYLTIFGNGLININTASITVLAALPGIDVNVAKAIEAQRMNRPFMSLEELKTVTDITDSVYTQLAPKISVQSDLYTIYIKAQLTDNPIFKEIIAVIDRSKESPEIVFWREN